jgi:hypothetical protein
MTFASRFPVHRERNTMLRLCIYLGNVSDRMFVGTIAFATITTWRRNRSTASQQRSQDKTKHYFQHKSPTAPIQIVSKGMQLTCDGHHI